MMSAEVPGSEVWFQEFNQSRTVSLGLRVKRVLEARQTDFQFLEVMETYDYGRIMVLDGLVMLTDRDEFVYHEMISHVPMSLHPSPRKILVIGGGDGGTVRELLRYREVEEIVLCEIDGAVINAAKEYFPALAAGFSHPKVKVLVEDGIELVRRTAPGSYDIVIIDSSDPVGPGVGLFNSDFYQEAARCLRVGGVMCAQTESPWLEESMLRAIQRNIGSAFRFVSPYVAPIPTYPRGLWSWTVAADQPLAVREADFRPSLDKRSLSYLTPELLRSAFHLPAFFAAKIAAKGH